MGRRLSGRGTQGAEEFDFLFVAGDGFLRRFEAEGEVAEFRMVDDADDGIESDGSFADIGVAILMGDEWIFGVVQVNCAESVETNDAIEFIDDAVEIVNDIVAAIVDMAGIEADTEPVSAVCPIDDFADFFERGSDFASFSRHGFEQDGCGFGVWQDCVEVIDDEFDSLFDALFDMRSGVEIIERSRDALKSVEFFDKESACHFPDFRLVGARVYRIGGMDDQGTETVFADEGAEFGHILGIGSAHFAALRVSDKALDDIGADSDGGLRHCGIAFGEGEMATEIKSVVHGERKENEETKSGNSAISGPI